MRAAALIVAAVLGLAAQGCGAPPSGATVLISGRDDHGLVRQPVVALQRSPEDHRVTASVADGTFAVVLDERASWLRVRTVERTPQEGWVNDFYLRDRAVDLDASEQVRLLAAEMRGDEVWVSVRPVSGPDAARWIPASRLREVGARDP